MEKKLILKAENGIHARPAANIATLCNKFKSDIKINGCNCKSIMNLMSSGIKKGQEITIVTSGEDEKEAMDALVELLNTLN
ncbi:HPr family phosphocarrier protein [Clostridium massiliodielmoense]|uniref:HPr family phosphocarrier protein n=1 Tax=Clostridium massiliodielmoense TaxID=1776385 RepID=UPI0004D51EBF|nr:HPr family phosphocarrier protein [Clostridium massiliodielmoense]KEH92430.1 serine kinase [Clostridium botulinum C/D str. BKT12695]